MTAWWITSRQVERSHRGRVALAPDARSGYLPKALLSLAMMSIGSSLEFCLVAVAEVDVPPRRAATMASQTEGA